MADQTQHLGRIDPFLAAARQQARAFQSFEDLLEGQGRLFMVQEPLTETDQGGGVEERVPNL